MSKLQNFFLYTGGLLCVVLLCAVLYMQFQMSQGKLLRSNEPTQKQFHSDYPLDTEISKVIEENVKIVHKVNYDHEKDLYKYYYRVTYCGPGKQWFSWDVFNTILTPDSPYPAVMELRKGKGYELVFTSPNPPAMIDGSALLLSVHDSDNLPDWIDESTDSKLLNIRSSIRCQGPVPSQSR